MIRKLFELFLKVVFICERNYNMTLDILKPIMNGCCDECPDCEGNSCGSGEEETKEGTE